MSSDEIRGHAGFIWSVADLLRGTYRQSDYGKVILPFVVIRRLDCVLEPTKDVVLKKAKSLKGKVENVEPVLRAVAGQQFYNTSPLVFRRLLDDPNHIADNLRSFLGGFSEAARDVIERFDFSTQIAKLDKANLLYKVVARFADIDLHPGTVSSIEMGYLYEELIRRFSELSNETAGEHFTPREVIRLMVNLLFIEDEKALTKKGIVRTLFDPACGTGGMLSVAEDHLRSLNPDARLEVFGQELNDESYAICRSDMMLKGQDASHIVAGNSFSEDGHKGARFDYLLANPPFGVEWKNVEEEVKAEAATKGFAGRFGAGLPRVNDGSFLFLQHMISKMKPPSEGGSRLAIVFNGSPLFNGGAGSGESEIRRWIIENDWLEAVVALPDQLFYNTGISTYLWVVTNRKSPERKGKVQLLDTREMWVKLRRSLGEKRKEITQDQIAEVTRLYGAFAEGKKVKILANESFGFIRITVERPRRIRYVVDEQVVEFAASLPDLAAVSDSARTLVHDLLAGWMGMEFVDSSDTKELQPYKKLWNYLATSFGPLPDEERLTTYAAKKLAKKIQEAAVRRDGGSPATLDSHGKPVPDTALRDNENVSLPALRIDWAEDPLERIRSLEYRSAVDDYVATEVLPYVPDAWVDHSRTKIGYEIPLTRHFYTYVPPRALSDIDADIKILEKEIQDLLGGVAE